MTFGMRVDGARLDEPYLAPTGGDIDVMRRVRGQLVTTARGHVGYSLPPGYSVGGFASRLHVRDAGLWWQISAGQESRGPWGFIPWHRILVWTTRPVSFRRVDVEVEHQFTDRTAVLAFRGFRRLGDAAALVDVARPYLAPECKVVAL